MVLLRWGFGGGDIDRSNLGFLRVGEGGRGGWALQLAAAPHQQQPRVYHTASPSPVGMPLTPTPTPPPPSATEYGWSLGAVPVEEACTALQADGYKPELVRRPED